MRLITMTLCLQKLMHHLHLKKIMKNKQKRGFDIAKSFVQVVKQNPDNLPLVIAKKYYRITKAAVNPSRHDPSDSNQKEPQSSRFILQLHSAGRGTTEETCARDFGL